jgi:hypothetical protein
MRDEQSRDGATNCLIVVDHHDEATIISDGIHRVGHGTSLRFDTPSRLLALRPISMLTRGGKSA